MYTHTHTFLLCFVKYPIFSRSSLRFTTVSGRVSCVLHDKNETNKGSIQYHRSTEQKTHNIQTPTEKNLMSKKEFMTEWKHVNYPHCKKTNSFNFNLEVAAVIKDLTVRRNQR